MLSIIMGITTAFNVLIIFRKIEKKRYEDAFFDSGLLILLTIVFGGSLGGMLVATVSSAVISMYFLWNPPKILPKFSTKDISLHADSKEVSDGVSLEDIYQKYDIQI